MKPVLLLTLTAGALHAQGYSVAEAEKHFEIAPGFHASVYAGEPDVRQPILVKFDNRGRLWTIQYLQYPNPAGLKRVRVDRYSRTVYDRVPEPPPRGPRGADRITILEETTSPGRASRFHDFVNGLNLCTGIAFGYGGVFVLQVPYLLFYPDRNGDDIPDSDPQVLLSGFGMEDAQSMANHLTWGPDGWLYGLNGSTTTSKIRDLEFQQGVWRYHPVTKKVELFAEGGGNIYGLTFDADGNLFYSSNGSALFWHAVQGGYYQKNFGKHGPLHNPYAYGAFPHVQHNGVNGGHIVLGGTSYSGDSFPSRFQGTFLGANFLSHHLSWWRISPLGSTVQAEYGGKIFDSRDTWSNLTDVAQGPDGAIYLCDFFDVRTAHPDPDAEWDRSNGRIYKVYADGTKPLPKFDLARMRGSELVALLRHPNGWFADQARVLLAERRDASLYPELRKMASGTVNGRLALQGLWSLYVSGGFDDTIASHLLSHPYQYVRYWTIRFLGDGRGVNPSMARQLEGLARSEPSVVVRGQLASSARRLPAAAALPVIKALLEQNRDAADPQVPWLLWWAIEDKAMAARDAVVSYFSRADLWDAALGRDNALRLIRRYSAEASAGAYAAARALLKAAPPAHVHAALSALDLGLGERAGIPIPKDSALYAGLGRGRLSAEPPPRRYAPMPAGLRSDIEARWKELPSDAVRARLALRAEVPGAEARVLARAADPGNPTETRTAALSVLEDLGNAAIVPGVLLLLEQSQPEAVRLAAMRVLARFDDASVATRLLALYEGMPAPLQSAAREILFSRAASAAQFLAHVEASPGWTKDVPPEQLRSIAALGSKDLDARVRRIWGNVGQGTPEEKLATMRRFNNDLRAATGDVKAGARVYTQLCARCHKLNGSGGDFAMDLTNANRADRTYLLTHIVDPSVFIRKEYMSYEIHTRNGRLVSGLMAGQDASGVTLMDAGFRRTTIPRSDIARIEESSDSQMPEGLLDPLTPQQLRDLFAYLQFAK
ncbi:MAG TPA: PVC-type heme-binding CxxCH protein [Bryobacteraceae bacterium]|nr:PVC-type heme-binding CxxCH protein [Bryobacteraceae bacterium]